jgi:hypothetical protein
LSPTGCGRRRDARGEREGIEEMLDRGGPCRNLRLTRPLDRLLHLQEISSKKSRVGCSGDIKCRRAKAFHDHLPRVPRRLQQNFAANTVSRENPDSIANVTNESGEIADDDGRRT